MLVYLSQFGILFSRMHSRCPLMYEWNKNKYYGAAHGLVGILFVLLQAGEKYFIEDAMKNNVKGSIDYLRSKLYPSGNVPQSHSSNNDKLVRWCHGAPGAIHLFILASHCVKFGHFYLITTLLKISTIKSGFLNTFVFCDQSYSHIELCWTLIERARSARLFSNSPIL